MDLILTELIKGLITVAIPTVATFLIGLIRTKNAAVAGQEARDALDHAAQRAVSHTAQEMSLDENRTVLLNVEDRNGMHREFKLPDSIAKEAKQAALEAASVTLQQKMPIIEQSYGDGWQVALGHAIEHAIVESKK